MKNRLIASILFLSATVAFAQDISPLDSDTEPDRIEWWQLEETFGELPDSPDDTTVGAVAKTLTNEYWRLLAEGYEDAASTYGVEVDVQAAQSESDQLGQLAIAETLLSQGYDTLLVSPQSDANLQPAFESALAKGIPVVNVNDAVIPDALQYVGNVQKQNGVRVANWFIDNFPDGGQVAVIEGQAGVYAAGQRTAGFTETINEAGNFEVVASVPADWSRQTAFDQATTILSQYPELIGFYANNDTMALGIVEAVKAAGRQDQVEIFGTDGISDAYASILAGELTGTVDSFPVLTGEVGVEVALRLLGGQDIPRVVSTPQALITTENYDRYKGEGVDPREALIEDAQSDTD